MTFRGRLTVFLSALVLVPLAAGGVAAHVLATRQAVRDADAKLQGAELGVQQAEQRALDVAAYGLTPALARRAVTTRDLDALRSSAGLGFLFVVRGSSVLERAMGNPRFAVPVTAETILHDPSAPVRQRRVRVLGAAVPETVVGGVYLDRGFLQSLSVPAMTVVRGRVVVSTLNRVPGDVTSRVPFDLPGGLRALCMCSGSRLSGVVVVAAVGHVGLMPGRSGWLLVLIAVGLVLGAGLAFELARVLSRPHDRALGRLAETERLSITDPLTGATNRRHLEAVLSDESKRAVRYRRPFSVLMIDVDHFKRINDTFGHAAGDRVLAEVAERIGSVVRSDLDTVARYGGEEFTVVLPETPLEGALVVAEKVRGTIGGRPFADELAVTVSVGVASCPDDGTGGVELLHVADRALYEAKRSGRDRVVAAR